LPYIKDYEPIASALIADRMEALIQQTGTNGFHFVDEAAPPALMRNLAIEIIRRKLVVTWWTNIRFEKSFTQDLCYLLAASGCIAVSGGLEVAADRLLQLIEKGVTVKQVAKVTSHFTKAGILVHAYLMYGFPTQTEQETLDSLEMVRQLFQAGTIQSGFWHRFAMTSHSPVGMHPEKFNVVANKAKAIAFADNDVDHEDPTGGDHEKYSFGLKKSLLNFMVQAHFEKPLSYWFDFKVPKTIIDPAYIYSCITEINYTPPKENALVIWLGNQPETAIFTQAKKGLQREILSMTFHTNKETLKIQLPKEAGLWLNKLLEKINIHQSDFSTFAQIKKDYENAGLEDFPLFWDNKPVNKLRDIGLIIV
jgi:hypothetical protein